MYLISCFLRCILSRYPGILPRQFLCAVLGTYWYGHIMLFRTCHMLQEGISMPSTQSSTRISWGQARKRRRGEGEAEEINDGAHDRNRVSVNRRNLIGRMLFPAKRVSSSSRVSFPHALQGPYLERATFTRFSSDRTLGHGVALSMSF